MCVESICTRSRESRAGAGARAGVRSRRHLSGGGHDYSSLLPRRAAKSTIVAAAAAAGRPADLARRRRRGEACPVPVGGRAAQRQVPGGAGARRDGPSRAGPGRTGDVTRQCDCCAVHGGVNRTRRAARRPSSRADLSLHSRAPAPPPPPPPRRLSCAARLGIELMIASPASSSSSSSSRRRGWSALSPATQIPFTAHELNSTLNRTAIRQFQCEQLHRTRPD